MIHLRSGEPFSLNVSTATKAGSVFRVLLCFSLGMTIPPHQLAAQAAINCLQAHGPRTGGPCKIARTGPTETIVVQVTLGGTPVNKAQVTFESRGAIRASTVTDGLGVATTQWSGASADSGDVAIKAVGIFDGFRVEQPILLTAIKKDVPGRFDFSAGYRKTGTGQHWYAGKQLPRPITLGILPGTDCSSSFVVFKALGEEASASPDTARAFLDHGKCNVRTYWKLGKAVGDQFMRATVVGNDESSVNVNARAHTTPWLAAGLAVAYLPQTIVGAKASSQSLQIVTKSALAETTFTKTITNAKPDTLQRLQIHPILGINTPIFTRWDRLRWSLAADAIHPTTDWFTGISLTQVFAGIVNEDIGADLHLMLHVARRDELKDVVACAATAACDTDKRTVVGTALSLQLNASNFLAAFTGLFAK